MLGFSNNAPTYQTKYYILDTSFLRDIPEQKYWVVNGVNKLIQPNSKRIVPYAVQNEFNKFMQNKPSAVESFMKTNFGTGEFIPYAEQVRDAFSKKMDDEIIDLGLEEKLLSTADKQIVQSAYELATQEKNVTILTGDEGIHAQALNLWKTAAIDIHTISPYVTPSNETPSILVMPQVLEELATLDRQAIKSDIYIALAKNLTFGSVKPNIAFGTYVNRTHQFTPPKINGVEYIALVYVSSGIDEHQSTKLAIKTYHKLKRAPQVIYTCESPQGSLFFMPTNVMSFIANEIENFEKIRAFLPEDEAKLREKQFTARMSIQWGKVDSLDLARHSPLSLGCILNLRAELKKKK
jgi:rRNA-processing protein FCF1